MGGARNVFGSPVHVGNIPLTPHSLKSNFIFTLPEKRFIQRIFSRSRALCSPLCTLMKIIHKFRPELMAMINWAALMNIFRLFSSHQAGIRRYHTSAHRSMHIWTLPENVFFKTCDENSHMWSWKYVDSQFLILGTLDSSRCLKDFNHVIVVLNFNLFS